ncbi:MAG: CoA-binding protein, partial [Chloroflexi bacterium]|nr:CoA-binding protein [Chloroflexota bacterium]
MASSIVQRLECLFNPKSVAIIGASNQIFKWGHDVADRVLESPASRKIFLINKSSPEILGVKAYKNIRDVPEPVEFAVIVIPFPGVPEVMRECVDSKVKVAVVITAGMGEAGEKGAQIQAEVVEIAKRGGLRFVGPNCMGHFNTEADFSTIRPGFSLKKGAIGLISQSGGFLLEIVQAGLEAGMGFSKVVSTGNEADLHFEDFLEYLAQDEQTRVIVGYVEGLREGRRFLELAREITPRKPIVILKVGRSPYGARAAKSHTSALSGDDALYATALNQAGVIRVDEIHEIFDVAAALLRQPRPRGKRVGILSSGGGHAVMTTDACQRAGLQIANLSPATIEKLNQVLPDRWPHANPVDTVAAGFVTYQALWPLVEDENVDAILSVGSIGMVSSWRGWLPSDVLKSDAQRMEELLEVVVQDELKNIDRAVEFMDKS